jgi:HPt (histidine-containing phosphotransfer) domain-containing protein
VSKALLLKLQEYFMLPIPSSQVSSGHLDMQNALLSIGDEQAMYDMLVMMAELLEQDVPKIANSVNDHDLAQAASLLHSLKGCIPIFCTPPLGAMLEDAEQKAKDGQVEQLSVAYQTLGPALQQLIDEIKVYIEKGLPA